MAKTSPRANAASLSLGESRPVGSDGTHAVCVPLCKEVGEFRTTVVVVDVHRPADVKQRLHKPHHHINGLVADGAVSGEDFEIMHITAQGLRSLIQLDSPPSRFHAVVYKEW